MTLAAPKLQVSLCACFLVDGKRFQISMLLMLPYPYKANEEDNSMKFTKEKKMSFMKR